MKIGGGCIEKKHDNYPTTLWVYLKNFYEKPPTNMKQLDIDFLDSIIKLKMTTDLLTTSRFITGHKSEHLVR